MPLSWADRPPTQETDTQIDPYLNFNGACEEAFGFYAKLLGGTVESISGFGDSPDAETHPAMRDKVMHARLLR